jgi:uncharacterized membrane protein
MKKLLACVVALGLAFAIGCENKSPPGGPGATGNNKTSEKGLTFKINPPTGVTLKQGEEKEVRIKVDRGKEFKQDVTLKFENPKGIHMKPESITVKAGETEAAVKVHADKDAPLGDKNVVGVVATPEKGESTKANMDVKVEVGQAP